MRLERLMLSEFRSYEKLDVDLSELSCAAIVGVNGAGKSSLLSAIDWCLYGTGSADSLLREGSSSGYVELVFSVDEQRYKVTRGREREKKSWLSLAQHLGHQEGVADHWASVASRTIADTQAAITELLGLTPEAFRASIYSPQGQAGVLAAMTAGDRKSLLGGLLGLGRYEDWRQGAAADARMHAAAASSIAGQAQRLSLDLAELERGQVDEDALGEKIKQAEGSLAEFEGEFERAQQRADARGQVELRAQLVASMNELKNRRVRLREARQELASLALHERAVATAKATVEGLRVQAERARTEAGTRRERKTLAIREETNRQGELSDLRATQRRLMADAEDLRRRRTELAGQLASLREEDARCFACNQPVGVEEVERLREGMMADNRALRRQLTLALEQAEKHTEKIAAAERAYVEAQAALDEFGEDEPAFDDRPLRVAENELDALRTQVSRLKAIEESIVDEPSGEELKQKWDELDERVRQMPKTVPDGPTVDQLRVAENEIRAQLERDRRALERAGADHERAIALRGELEAAEDHAEEEQERGANLEILARAFSRDGIPALILDGAVSGIELAANVVLEGLGSPFKVRLATQRALKSKGVAETLDILVDDGLAERELSTFSGGERYRVNLALRLGLAEALSQRSLDILLIDEVTDLDAEGTRTLADTLTTLAPERQVLVVSHDPALADAMPQHVSVTRRSAASPSELAVL